MNATPAKCYILTIQFLEWMGILYTKKYTITLYTCYMYRTTIKAHSITAWQKCAFYGLKIVCSMFNL